MHKFLISRARSFHHAFAGVAYVIRTQHNARIHFVATGCVIILSAWLSLPGRDWAVLVLSIGTVWTAEIINTALEAVVDLASPQRHPLAKVGKDVGAAAVLIAAFSAAIIGILILAPPLWLKLKAMSLIP
jgi:diacylglycerol kinase (ATP)